MRWLIITNHWLCLYYILVLYILCVTSSNGDTETTGDEIVYPHDDEVAHLNPEDERALKEIEASLIELDNIIPDTSSGGKAVIRDMMPSSSLSSSSSISLQDQGDYTDTNAIIQPDENLDISRTINDTYYVRLSVRTSHSYLAATNDVIQAMFIGDFSSSGPHDIPYQFNETGKHVSFLMELSRQIGNLTEIMFYNMGYDGWLPASVSCQKDQTMYTLAGSRQWVDSYNPSLFHFLDKSAMSLDSDGVEESDDWIENHGPLQPNTHYPPLGISVF